jgi:hypothetical protein
MLKVKVFSILALIFFFTLNPILNAQVIKDDFRVNDDTLGGGCYAPDVELLENGGEIIVWEDYRNGTGNTYGQLFDDTGDSTGTNFKVSTYPGSFSESAPAIASFGDSLLVISQAVSGQWLLSDGSQSGYAFNTNSGTMYTPDVEVNNSGFFVVWRSFISGAGQEILLKRFSLNGDSIGPRIVLNDDETSENQELPCIAMNDDGSSVVVWQDRRTGFSDIYGQLISSSGDTTGGNFLVNDDGGSIWHHAPSCAMDFEGNFVVVWYDYRNGDADIYGQRFDASGDTTGLGGNFLINDDGGDYYQYEAWCAMDSAGNFIVAWIDYRNGNSDVYAQRFDQDGNPIGSNFRINQETGPRDYWDTRISMDENKFVVTWQSYVAGTSNTYKRSFQNDGNPLSSEIRINEIVGTGAQRNPAIDINAGGSVIATWQDYRTDMAIYFQRLNVQGDTLGGNIRVAVGHNPDVAVSEDSSFAISYDNSGNIYFQKFSPNGDSLGPAITISDTSLNSRTRVSIDVDSENNHIVTWEDRRSGEYDIYAQLIDSAGDTVGGNFLVSDDVGGHYQNQPSIAISPSGAFLVTWEDERNGNSDIFGQVYGSDGNPIDSNFRIDSGGTDDQYAPDAASLPDGNFVVTWYDYRTPRGIYAQIVDSTGTLIDTNFKVSDQFYAYIPSVSVTPTGAFVIAWRAYASNDYDIYAQKYNADYSPDSTNFKVNNETEGPNTQQDDPCVAANENSIIFAWEDAKWQKGWDIAAKVIGWDLGGIEEVGQEGKGVKILNISNPILSGKEWLSISLDSPAKVDFQLINVAGVVVSSKKLDYKTPGIKRVEFDVSKMPCGPYFLSFETDRGRAIKKTVVIK